MLNWIGSNGWKNYQSKAAFVSAENGFRKTIYTLPYVWVRMENLVKWKIISVDRKINPSDRENDFRSYFTFKAFLEFLSSIWSDSPSASTPPHTPTRGRQSSTPHAGTSPRSTHTPTSSAAVFPSAPVGFLPFLLFSHSTSHPRSRLDHAVEIVPQHCWDCVVEIIAHDPPMTDLSLSRSICPFPSIFDNPFFHPLLGWPNCGV